MVVTLRWVLLLCKVTVAAAALLWMDRDLQRVFPAHRGRTVVVSHELHHRVPTASRGT